MNKFNMPNLGFGMGLRTKHYDYILNNKPKIDWFEIVSENFIDSYKPRKTLKEIQEHYPIVMHGVSMSIGSLDPIDFDYLKKLKELIKFIEPVWVSDHLCWTGINKKNTHDLLPVPYNDESLKNVVNKIKIIQDYLERTIAFENPSTYLEFKSSDMAESEFIKYMAQESNSALLLDVNNVYVSCFNHKLDPKKYIDDLPLDRVVQIHLAGHSNNGNHIIDTHDDHVIDEVWEIYKYVSSSIQVATMVEWDGNIPDFDVVLDEVNKAKLKLKEKEINLPNFNTETKEYKNANLISDQENLQFAILEQNINTDWIIPKSDFKEIDQLNVYVHGYRARLFDSIIEDFPVLRENFKYLDELVQSYIESTPSKYYNLGSYANDFVDYLYNSKEFIEEKNCDFELVTDIARFENSLSRIYDAKEIKPISFESLTEIDPDEFVNYYFKPVTEIISEYSHNINKFYVGENLVKEKSYVAIYIKNNEIYRLDLSKNEYQILNEFNNNLNIGEVFEKYQDSDILDPFQEYIVKWVSSGIIYEDKNAN